MLLYKRINLLYNKIYSINKLRNLHTQVIPTNTASDGSINYTQERQKQFDEFKKKYINWEGPYPTTPYKRTISIELFRKKYENTIQPGIYAEDEPTITICARIKSLRYSSNTLVFQDLQEYSISNNNIVVYELQCIATNKYLDEFSNSIVQDILNKYDWISVQGIPGKSRRGEFSIIAKKIQLISPCLEYIPNQLIDINSRQRYRSIDFIINSKDYIRMINIRHIVLQILRNFFIERGCVEVETPIMWLHAGGAIARPFLTSSNIFGDTTPLSLRIAPELFLKQIILGGIERIFEIGKVFRNEGMDPTHNPEFTSCEVYMANTSLEYMMDITEKLFRILVSNIHSSTSITIDDIIFDFSKPFQRIDIYEALNDCGILLPQDLHTPESLEAMLSICRKHNIQVPKPITNAKVLDKIIHEFIESKCIQPTFLLYHPIILSPLAKRDDKRPYTAQRFEQFINRREYVNAYNEQNIPSEQQQRFIDQASLPTATNAVEDEEAHIVDIEYCKALQCGLPPTVGWGIGIDRLIMLLMDASHIRNTILFPLQRPSSK